MLYQVFLNYGDYHQQKWVSDYGMFVDNEPSRELVINLPPANTATLRGILNQKTNGLIFFFFFSLWFHFTSSLFLILETPTRSDMLHTLIKNVVGIEENIMPLKLLWRQRLINLDKTDVLIPSFLSLYLFLVVSCSSLTINLQTQLQNVLLTARSMERDLFLQRNRQCQERTRSDPVIDDAPPGFYSNTAFILRV